MNSWKNKLMAFMYGRYGIDELYYALLIAGTAACVAGAFTDSLLLRILYVGCFVWMLYRCFSRNLIARRAENEKYKKIRDAVKSFCKVQWLRIKECRTHVYRSCPACPPSFAFPAGKESITPSVPAVSTVFPCGSGSDNVSGG